MNSTSSIELLTGLATLTSIGFVIIQLRQSVNQEVRELIAEYNTRYIEIAARIPYEILVENKTLDELHHGDQDRIQSVRRAFYDYFLLCEEQIALVNERTHRDSARSTKGMRVVLARLTRDVSVWIRAADEWEAGMVSNFRRRATRDLFKTICDQLDEHGENESHGRQQSRSFSNLREVVCRN
jgi:hypothetical protein